MRIVQGDITQLTVDVIVNAANLVILGGGGVDGAIHRAAGKELFDACLKVPEVRLGVRCPTGEARITLDSGFLQSSSSTPSTPCTWTGSMASRRSWPTAIATRSPLPSRMAVGASRSRASRPACTATRSRTPPRLPCAKPGSSSRHTTSRSCSAASLNTTQRFLNNY